MLSRRRFLKIFGLASIAFSILPTILWRRSFSYPLKDEEAEWGTTNWLYGLPHRGCSTPHLSTEYQEGAKVNLKELEIVLPSR